MTAVVLLLFVPGAVLCWFAALCGSVLALPLGAERAGFFLLVSAHWGVKLFKVSIRALLGNTQGGEDEAQRRD